MFCKTLRSESGFGLIQAVAAVFIASIAIAGLLMASYIARHQAIGNYHYKVVLLKGLETLEEVKYRMHLRGDIRPIYVVNNMQNGEFIIDDNSDVKVKGFIQPLTVQTFTEIIISPYVKYDRVTVKLTWRDGPRYFVNAELNQEKQITLIEDYFYRSDQLATP